MDNGGNHDNNRSIIFFCGSVLYTVFHLLSHKGKDADIGAWYEDRDGKMAIQPG